jgi:hypothetical protein
LDLKVKTRSNGKIDIKYEFLDPKNPRKHMLISPVGQTIEKLIFDMAGGSHIGFWPPTKLAHTFVRVTLAIFFN